MFVVGIRFMTTLMTTNLFCKLVLGAIESKDLENTQAHLILAAIAAALTAVSAYKLWQDWKRAKIVP
ncbi:MAG: hypothetical protein WC831_00905 [Parcubacteria group bacterium]